MKIRTFHGQYAKRQMTWLKRDKVNAQSREGALGYKGVVWVESNDFGKVEGLVQGFIS